MPSLLKRAIDFVITGPTVEPIAPPEEAARWSWRGDPFGWLWFCKGCPGSPPGMRPDIRTCPRCGEEAPSPASLYSAIAARIPLVR
jgi:hypothetical protein